MTRKPTSLIRKQPRNEHARVTIKTQQSEEERFRPYIPCFCIRSLGWWNNLKLRDLGIHQTEEKKWKLLEYKQNMYYNSQKATRITVFISFYEVEEFLSSSLIQNFP